MTGQDVQQLYAFNTWARQRLLDALGKISEEELHRDLRSSFPSIHATIVHVVAAEDLWYGRLTGLESRKLLTAADLPTLAEIRTRWLKIGVDFESLVGSLKEDRLEEVFSFRNVKGELVSQKIWQALQHIVNHSTYHRGQITTMMRQLGATPPGTDLIAFYRSRNG